MFCFPNMDRFTQQFFGGRAKTAYTRSEAPGEPREKESDTRGLFESMARSFAKSAAKRAMNEMSGQRTRGPGGGGGGHVDRPFNAEDFEKLGGFVLEMVSTVKEGNDRRREKKKRRKHRERKRGGDGDGERARGGVMDRDIGFDDDYYEQPTYDSKRRSKRRRHGDSGSPLHVSFAEPLEGFDYAPPRKHRRRRHHRRDEPEEPYERASGPDRPPRDAGVAYNPASPFESSSDRRRSERRSHRPRPKINLQSLRTELEDMSSTIIGLNARSANHRDCEFYDKFVRKGGRLQERIGDTLGQIRNLEEGGDGYASWHDDERRARKRRRRERDYW